MSRQTALAEGQHAIDVQPRRTYAKRVLYEVDVSIAGLIDLTQPAALSAVGITMSDVGSDDMSACQRVAGAAAWLDRDGLLVPSARDPGHNLVILVGPGGLEDDLEIISTEVVEARTQH